jgi:hypothetical protein
MPPDSLHRTILRRVVRKSLVACVLLPLMLGSAFAGQETTPEYTLKAAFIYSFARFTNWAERPDKLLHLCVLGRDPFGSALDTIDNKEVGQQRIAVKRLRDVNEAIRTCQIVFISDSEMENFLLQPAPVRLASGVITVADREGASRQGVIVELTTADQRVGFEFNQESARQAKIEVSSKLLRLARKVY